MHRELQYTKQQTCIIPAALLAVKYSPRPVFLGDVILNRRAKKW